MTSDNEMGDENSEIQTDDDWKSRVKAEDAALDQSFAEDKNAQQADTKTGDATPTDDAAPTDDATPEAAGKRIDPGELPPVTFAVLVSMFSTQAMVSLGLIPSPATGEADVQLELARHFIDLLGVLEEKTKGNLETAEEILLTDSLHQLRMAFVEKSREV